MRAAATLHGRQRASCRRYPDIARIGFTGQVRDLARHATRCHGVSMRPSAGRNDAYVKAFPGTTGLLLAFDVDDEGRDGLLGSAVCRTDLQTRKSMAHRWGSLATNGGARFAGLRPPAACTGRQRTILSSPAAHCD